MATTGEKRMSQSFVKLGAQDEKVHLLRMIRRFSKVTRGKIVQLTGFSSAKISLLIKELESENLIMETGEEESTGGRKARYLQLKGERGCFLGIELGSYELKATLVDFSGAILANAKMLEDPTVVEPELVIRQLLYFLRQFLEANKSCLDGCLAVGLALSGIVDDDSGVCRYFRNQKNWEGLSIRSLLEHEFGLPCVIDDSSRMMALAERLYGTCQGVDNFILYSVGFGLGTGIFVDGRLFRGSRGLAGELGHMVIKENGPRCVCGNYGCLESFVSGYAIERQLVEALRDNVYSSLAEVRPVSARELVSHAKAGDKLAFSILNDAAKHLGTGIANTINIFNPELIVLAGGLANAGTLLLEPIIQVVKASSLKHSADCAKIVFSSLDEYSAALGAANKAIDHILDKTVL
jgi:predicted NBD/HSP70 family sugar kinase